MTVATPDERWRANTELAVLKSAVRGLAEDLEREAIQHEADLIADPDVERRTTEVLRKMNGKPPVGLRDETAADWPDPDPFGASTLPEFPVDVLSDWQRDWTKAEAEFTQTPLDLPGMLCLASTALAVSRGTDVEVRSGWKEPTNVWFVYGAQPGERKSPVFQAATAPIFLFQDDVAKKMAPKVAERQSARRILEGQIAKAESAAIAGKQYGGCDPRRTVHELQAQLVDLPELAPPVLIADDATQEAMARLMAGNGEKIGMFSAEGGPFAAMEGKYTDKGADLAFWLKCHSGDTHAVHRIKRESLLLKRPLVTLAITCQPHVIRGLAEKDGFRGQGLLARLVFALPKSTMGSRHPDGAKVPDTTRRGYNAALLELLASGDTPRLLTMSEGADQARRQLHVDLEPRLGPDGDLFPIADWAAKLVGLVARVAGILHVSDHAADLGNMSTVIPVATWLRAQAFGNYALAHARHAFAIMGSDGPDELAKRVWAWVVRQGRREFTQRDAYKAAHVSLDEALPALERLEQRALVRLRPKGKPTGGRPAGPVYDVNPGVELA